MIIQCEKCQTRFRLDDSRVTDKGVKVRCTKCKHVFTVRKEETAPESCEPERALTGFTYPAAKGGEVDYSGFDFGDNTPDPDSTLPSTASADDFTDVAIEPAPVAPQQEAPQGLDFSGADSFETSSFDASEISFESDEDHAVGTADSSAVAEEPVAVGGEVDFSSFNFGDSESEPDPAPLSASSTDAFSDREIKPASATPLKAAPQGLDFSDDAMFGEVVQDAPEASTNTISFDFGEDSFAESMDMTGQDSSGRHGSLFSLDTPAPSDAPFNLGEIDFGDELTSVAVQQVNPEDLKPSQEILFAPLAEAREKTTDDELTRSFLGDDAADQQELPPLSIASRRKQGPLFGWLIAVAAVLVISVFGYLGYSSFSNPRETAALEAGKIGLQAVKASYIENDEAGELLVISGEALNEYSKARAALQVKVTVYDAAGQSLATKTAYGGNPLSEEQLESLPLDKIEAAMANQFGDSLANMEVAPGKAIPFVVVVAKIPKGARDFDVQSAGSTVAAGKHE